MRQAIAGYTITEKIHSSPKTLLYRARRASDETPVIIKVPNEEYPTLADIIRLKNQYSIAKNLDISGIVKALSLETYKNSFALILEDFGGISLFDYIKNKEISLANFLKISIQIADALEGLHQNRIIHKDIKPHNILINPQTGLVKITDFSISSLLPREQASLTNPNGLEGTLAYMSPEQTGRMNRGIDYRTDFYSLGVTFYEILTGELPFSTTDPMELVHCHIALAPKPIIKAEGSYAEGRREKGRKEIPAAISDIVMKLMAKTAEDRYQSARGLKADLATCLRMLETTGNISPFVLGQQDISDRFQIPEKLYGREAEIETLMAAFGRVASGSTEIVLVSGYSGIGKSALVREIHKPIARERGYFISGKFDQFKRNIPFAPFIQALQNLIRQLLTESPTKLAIWKKKISEAVGANGQVILDVIPDLERIIGQQSPVVELQPGESQNRFNLVFQNFIRLLASAEHPLVLFLDDLQWADSASLKLLQLLLSDGKTQYLLAIAAYRDNEVGAVHPLMLTLDAIKKTGAIVNEIVLQPLEKRELNRLIAEALSCPEERAKPLSELAFQKTQGNPFFASQFLKSLYEEGLLYYVAAKHARDNLSVLSKGSVADASPLQGGGWQCDIAKVKAIALSDNIVEFMAQRLQKLPESALEVLKLAACIGHQFDLETLARGCDRSFSETAASLWKVLQEGLVLPLSEVYKFFADERELGAGNESPYPTYKFLHDRVQQAAYSLIPETDKKATHLKIGQRLLENSARGVVLEKLIGDREAKNSDSKASILLEKIFEIVNQLNVGAELIATEEEKLQLAQLNLIAGRKAKSANAYEPAVRYLNVGLELLADNCWQSHYYLALNLHVEAVEAEYLTTNFERSRQLSEIALQHAQTLLEKVKVYEILIQFYIAQNQMQAALETGLQVLEMLGVTLEREPPKKVSIDEIINLPPMTDPYKLAALRILMNVGSAVFIANPPLYPLVVFTQVTLCLNYGNSNLAAYIYVYYGLLLCGVMGDIDSGYQIGQLAVKLLEKFDARNLKSKVYELFNSCVRHWKEPFRETIEPLQEGIQAGLETGDLQFAALCAMTYCQHLIFIGEPLEFIEAKQAKYIEMMRQIKQEFQTTFSNIFRQMVLNLTGESSAKGNLIGESFNEVEMLPFFIEAKAGLLLFGLYFSKAMLFYLFREGELALENARLAEQYESSGSGSLQACEHNFYYSLVLLTECRRIHGSDRQEYLRIVSANQEKMKSWAFHAPCNFQHKYELVEAEMARVLGDIPLAMELYDRAIKGAQENLYIHEEALAGELAAEFYLSLGREKIAQTYIMDAYYGYARWGATAKVRDLEQRYPQLLQRITSRETPGFLTIAETTSIISTRTNTSTTSGNSTILDLATIMKASLAFAEEIALDKLLAKLMRVIIENAGADKGFLILEKAGELVVEASGSLDSEEVSVLHSIPVESNRELPESVIHYVDKTQEYVVLNEAANPSIFTGDRYIATRQPKSVLCFPILHKGKRIAILYLENNAIARVFTADRLEVLKLLSSQAAVSLENALLYQNLQQSEAKLQSHATQLEKYLHDLQQAQVQLVQSEKMSSLGQLIAGVAHEINNPVGFIHGNLSHAVQYASDLIEHLQLYRDACTHSLPEIQEHAEAIDLEYLVEDLPKMLNSMKLGTDRINEIVRSLRNFSRHDTDKKTKTNIHQGIDSTLLILSNRLKARSDRPGIQVIKEYGNLPEIECYAGPLNQVFMNLIANAIDALEEVESRGQQIGEKIENYSHQPLTIHIRTEVIDDKRVAVRIADNGPGMSPEVQNKLFKTFFTTKPQGKGTGLGLSISYQIVVEKHKGQLRCISAPGQGTEFTIEIPIRQ